MEELKKYLSFLKREAKEELSSIPEIFNDLTDSENYNFYSGFLRAINYIDDFISFDFKHTLI